MRKPEYFAACTVDGFIAAQDGSLEAFFNDRAYFADLFESFPETCPDHLREVLGVRGENRHFDTVLMGRNTYALGLKIGLSSPYPTLKQYAFSTTMGESTDEDVTLVPENAAGLVGELKSEPGKDIWLASGASLAGNLFSEGFLDELLLKLNPVVLGSGIPLFPGGMSLVGWLESTVYVGLFFVAGFACAMHVLGIRLIPGKS
jgi:dihydrofolate reductase